MKNRKTTVFRIGIKSENIERFLRILLTLIRIVVQIGIFLIMVSSRC